MLRLFFCVFEERKKGAGFLLQSRIVLDLTLAKELDLEESHSFLYLLLHWFVSGSALLLTAKLVPGFHIRSFRDALIAAVVIGLANIFIWPVLIFLTLPLNILTLGLFTFVINGVVLKICAGLLKGFDIDSWLSAIFGAIVLSLVGVLLHYILI